MKIAFQFISIIFIAFIFATCGNADQTGTTNDASATTEQAANEADEPGSDAPEYASAYICPMHCKGSGSDKEGKCPVCKMDYVANKDHEMHRNHGHDHDHDGHDHDHDHDGHDHDHNHNQGDTGL